MGITIVKSGARGIEEMYAGEEKAPASVTGSGSFLFFSTGPMGKRPFAGFFLAPGKLRRGLLAYSLRRCIELVIQPVDDRFHSLKGAVLIPSQPEGVEPSFY